VRNITVDGTGGSAWPSQLHGINVYQSTGVTLDTVSALNFGGSGVVVNGSTVTAANLTTGGNSWNGVNVDPGSGVTLPSVFTLNSGTLAEPTQIKSDGDYVSESATVTVNAPGYTKYKVAGTPALFFWTTRPITNAATITSGGNSTYYTTIQAAINAAAPGDTINVGAGAYTTTGQVLIDKNLTIIGTGGKPVISPAADLTATTNVAGAWFLINPGVTFNLQNVAINGNGKVVTQAIRNHGNSTIDNVDFSNIYGGHKYVGLAVSSYGGVVSGGSGSDTHGGIGGAASTLTVTSSTFTNIQRIGVLVKGTEAAATITGNTYTGKGVGDFLDYAFEAGAGANVTIGLGNVITNNRGVAVSDGSTSAGILVTDYWGPGTGALIEGSTITNNTNGVAIGYNETDNSIVVAHNNKFEGNTANAIHSTHPVVNATNNWWGNPTGPTFASNVGGTGDGISTSTIAYAPWYINSGRTVLSNAFVGDTITATSGSFDLEQTAPGEASLPGGATQLTLSDTSVLDLSAGLVGDAVVLNSGVANEPIVLTNSNLADVSASIPDGTTITGPTGWNGVITPPVSIAASGDAPAGFSVGGTSISIGSPDGTLVFSNPVTIVLAGVTGPVGYKPAGATSWVRITAVCGGSYATTTGPAAPGECAISDGTDTKILTYHFTTFGGLTPAAPVISPNGSNFMSSVDVTMDTAAGTTIHYTTDGSTPTCSSTEYTGTLNFSRPSTVLKAIRCDGTGASSSVSTALFSLISGGGGGGGGGGSSAATPATPATPAVPTVTAATPATPATPAQGQVLGAEAYAFTKDLHIGSSGTDVTELQKVLIAEGFDIPAITKGGAAYGTFGGQTLSAVIAYQRAHGVSPAKGYVSTLTRAELNKGGTASGASAAGKTNLTAAQANSILSLVESFGADASVVAKIKATLGL
jgi:hypothetical protein